MACRDLNDGLAKPRDRATPPTVRKQSNSATKATNGQIAVNFCPIERTTDGDQFTSMLGWSWWRLPIKPRLALDLDGRIIFEFKCL